MNNGKVRGSLFGGRSSSLPPESRRTIPPQLETTIFKEAVVESSGSGSASTNGSSTPIGTSRRWALPNFMSPRIRLDSPYREQFDKLDRESKQACSGLSAEDVIKYLCFKVEEQQHFNEHTLEDRKTFLLLTDLDREECCKWQNVDNRCLYLKLTSEEKIGYRKYAEFLVSRLSENIEKRRVALSKNKELLKHFMQTSPEERKIIVQKRDRLLKIKSALDTAKKWEMTKEERAKSFCGNGEFVAPLNEYLETCGSDTEALEDLGGLMVTSGLVSTNDFKTIDDVQTWIRTNTPQDH